MSSPASNMRSNSSALAVFLPLISFHLVVTRPAYGYDANRFAPDGEEGDPVLAFDYSDDSASRLRLAPGVDFNPVIVRPEYLCSFEIDPVLGFVGRAFVAIELEG